MSLSDSAEEFAEELEPIGQSVVDVRLQCLHLALHPNFVACADEDSLIARAQSFYDFVTGESA